MKYIGTLAATMAALVGFDRLVTRPSRTNHTTSTKLPTSLGVGEEGALYVEVYCNGKKLFPCVYADTERGVAIVYCNERDTSEGLKTVRGRIELRHV